MRTNVQRTREKKERVKKRNRKMRQWQVIESRLNSDIFENQKEIRRLMVAIDKINAVCDIE